MIQHSVSHYLFTNYSLGCIFLRDVQIIELRLALKKGFRVLKTELPGNNSVENSVYDWHLEDSAPGRFIPQTVSEVEETETVPFSDVNRQTPPPR